MVYRDWTARREVPHFRTEWGIAGTSQILRGARLCLQVAHRITCSCLCMGISDEIEVATIELPIHSRLTTSVVQRRQRNLPKTVCCTFRVFVLLILPVAFFLLSRFRRRCSCTRLASRVATQTNAKYATISPKKPSIWRKTCATKSTSASTHAEARYL